MRQTTSQRLQQLMLDRDLKQVDILRMSQKYQEELGVKLSKSSLSEYISGSSLPDQYKLTLLGKTLGVSEAWLMGYNVPMVEPKNAIIGDNHGMAGDNHGTVTINNGRNQTDKDYNATMQKLATLDGDIQTHLLKLLTQQVALMYEKTELQKSIDKRLATLIEIGEKVLDEINSLKNTNK